MMSYHDPEDAGTGDLVYLRCSCCQMLVQHICDGMPKADTVDIVTKRRENFKNITASDAASDEQNQPDTDIEADTEPEELPAKRRRKINPRYDKNFVQNFSQRGLYKKFQMTTPPTEAPIAQLDGLEGVVVEIDNDAETLSDGEETLFMINEEDFEEEEEEEEKKEAQKATERKTKMTTKIKNPYQKEFKTVSDYLFELSDPHCVVAADGENIECTACKRLISHVHLPEKRHRIDNLRSHCSSQAHKEKAKKKSPVGTNSTKEILTKGEKEVKKIWRSDSPYFWNQTRNVCVCCEVRVANKDQWKSHCHTKNHKDRFTSLKASPAFSVFCQKRGASVPAASVLKKKNAKKSQKRLSMKPKRAGTHSLGWIFRLITWMWKTVYEIS